MHATRRAVAACASAVLLVASLAACSGDDETPVGADGTTESTTPTPADTTTSAPEDDGTAEVSGSEPFGPGCDQVTGQQAAGSLEELAGQPVVEALGDTATLVELGAALQASGVAEQLDDLDDITLFAPNDQAFSELGAGNVADLMTDPQGRLAEVLRYHVVQERVRPTDLPGSFQTLQGEELTIEGSGEDLTVDGDASIVCGNVETQNATLYLVDGVLTPPGS